MHDDYAPHLEIQTALDSLSYCANNVSRWATSARIARLTGGNDFGLGYLELVKEELEKMAAVRSTLLAALDAAYVQHDTRETLEIAA